MAARAMWKGTLDLEGALVPVKLYAGVEDRDVRFRLVEARTRIPVRQRMIDPRTEQEVPPDEIRRGIEVEPGTFVILKEEELDGVAPEPSRTIEVLRTVPPSAIDPAWFVRPYFLGPDGAATRYAALAVALEKSGLSGVVRFTMRGRLVHGALFVHGTHLALVTLRPADELSATLTISAPESKAASEAERKLARQLIAALSGSFEPGLLHDEYRERLQKFVDARAAGREAALPKESVPRPSRDLLRGLERSVAALRRKPRAA